jgi:hypothetical protein
MSTPLKPAQRLRYFDGEYLRSYDFTDEQSYHVAMRRLMNLKLHLHGIVLGLELQLDADSVPGGPLFFSITAGLAIDRLGREILVPAPYSLSNLLTAPGLTGGGRYEVWLCYQETETSLPAAGYTDCNVQNQTTRLQEGFQVQLKALSGPSLFTDCGGVRLGTVQLTLDSSGFSQAHNTGRTFVGIRAQRVIAPDELDQTPDPFDITATANPPPDQLLPGYLDIHPGLFGRGNAIIKKNLVVGDDFVLDNTLPNSTNLPPGSAIPDGSQKITGDLFLNGDFYGQINGTWYKLQDYIQTLMPTTVIGTTSFIIPPGTITSGSAPIITLSGAPAKSSKQQVMLAITETDWRSTLDLANWSTNNNPATVAVSVGSLANAGGTWQLVIDWTVTPAQLVSGSNLLPVTGLTVSYLVLFMP